MLTLKDIDPSEIEMITKEIPQVECMCCHDIARPVRYSVTAKEWLQAAHQCGWRQVQTDDVTYSMVCPGCVNELEDIEREEAAILAQGKCGEASA